MSARRYATYACAISLFAGFLSLIPTQSSATTLTASNETTLLSAISAANTGDIVEFSSDIVVNAAVSISKAITLDGNGYTISVPRPGVTEAGANEASPSNFRVFTLSGSLTVALRDMTIKGGNAQGAGVYVSTGTTAQISGVRISNSRYAQGGGGGIYNAGITYLTDSVIEKNSASYGGGFLNPSGKSMFVKNTMFANNRSESSSGGGGAAENQGTLYINNSTFSNNASTEIGGAINNYYGTLYVSGSSFTGNVAYGGYGGGAIGRNGGSANIVSSLFAYNYSRSAGTTASPSAYRLDDVGVTGLSITTGTGVTLRYSVYHAATTSATVTNSTAYAGAADGSDNSLFTGGNLEKLIDGTGSQIGTAFVFKPFLVRQNGILAPALKTSSTALGEGTPIQFNATTGATAYYDRLAGTPAWSTIVGSPANSDLVTLDQYGETRHASTPAAGAVERIFSNLYSLKSVQASGGSVSGASVFGEVYPAGTEVTVTAIPNAGQTFSAFTLTQNGSTTSVTSNPITVTLNASAVIEPSFAVAASGVYTVSYASNNAGCGTTPPVDSSSLDKTIATNSGATALKRDGYEFAGWNTMPNGSGTDYAGGTTYNTVSNLSLYAKWTVNTANTNVCTQSAPSASPTPTAATSVAPLPSASASANVTPSATPTATAAKKSTTGASKNISTGASSSLSPSSTPSPIEILQPSASPSSSESSDSITLTLAEDQNKQSIDYLTFLLGLFLLLLLWLFIVIALRRRSRRDS